MRTLWNQQVWGRQLPKRLPSTPIFGSKEKRDKASKRRTKKNKPVRKKPIKKQSLLRRLLAKVRQQ